MTYKLKLNQVREVLGMEIKLEAVKLIDGVTTVEYERLEPGFPLFVLAEDGSTKSLAPVGTHTLEDGTVVEVDEAGLLVSVSSEETPTATEDVVEVSGSKSKRFKKLKKFKKFEEAGITEEAAEIIEEIIEEKIAEILDEVEMKEEEKVDVAMTEEIKEAIKELVEEKVEDLILVVEEVATEIASIKEEMNAMKTKMEKFSKAPATNGIPKFTDTPTVFDAFESKAAFLKNAMKK
jgi:hypothetical protein